MFLLKNAQLAGLVSGLIDGLSKVLGGWFETLMDWLWMQIINVLYTIIMMPILLLIDGLSILFRKFAGLGSYVSNGVKYTNNDFLYALITNDSIKNIFWSMLILGVVLLFITTFVAIIKSETVPFDGKNGENNKWKILKTTFRSIINFAIVPICAFVGIMIGNVLLRSLDAATGGGKGASMANRVFVSSAYQCNKVRIIIDLMDSGKSYKKDGNYDDVNDLALSQFKAKFEDLTENQRYELAQLVDDKFIYNDSDDRGSYCGYWSIISINKYYDLTEYNLVLGIIEGIVIAALMIILTIGLIKRLFSVVTLFVIAPPLIAITPLKPDALKGWNSSFIGQVISGYAAVVTMNMYLIIMGAMSDIQFISADEFFMSGFINSIVMILIAAAGLFFVKDISSEVAKIIGGADALAEGQKVAQRLAKTAAIGVGAGKAAIFHSKTAAGKNSARQGLNAANNTVKNELRILKDMQKNGSSAEAIAKQRERLAAAQKSQKEARDLFNEAKAAHKDSRNQFRDQVVQFSETFTETGFIDARQKDKIRDDMYYGKSKSKDGKTQASLKDRIETQAAVNSAKAHINNQRKKDFEKAVKERGYVDKDNPNYEHHNKGINERIATRQAELDEVEKGIDLVKENMSENGVLTKEGKQLLKDWSSPYELFSHNTYLTGENKGRDRNEVANEKIAEIRASAEKADVKAAEKAAEEKLLHDYQVKQAKEAMSGSGKGSDEFNKTKQEELKKQQEAMQKAIDDVTKEVKELKKDSQNKSNKK